MPYPRGRSSRQNAPHGRLYGASLIDGPFGIPGGQVPAIGAGEDELAPAAKVRLNPGSTAIEIENYAIERVALGNVKSDRAQSTELGWAPTEDHKNGRNRIARDPPSGCPEALTLHRPLRQQHINVPPPARRLSRVAADPLIGIPQTADLL